VVKTQSARGFNHLPADWPKEGYISYYMKTALLVFLALLSASACQAQTVCDSLYERAQPFKGIPMLTWMEKAPAIIVGKERLLTYHVPAERVGEAYFQVVIDEGGEPRCLQWLNVTSALVQAEAAKVVSSLRFAPGAWNGKPYPIVMTLVVRFKEGPPPTRSELRKARHAQVH
jgi:hypothetical protein